MVEMVQGRDAQFALAGAGPNSISCKLEEPDHSSAANRYFSRDEIEKNSPSRKDGIDVKKETYLRKSYCTFLQDLGMRLKVPQVTIATAIIFCHRFFLHQSHHRNDCYMVATICMFIAGKVEETPRSLRDVILMSYENHFKKGRAAVHRIKQKDVYEAEKEKVLLGERLVLTTLGFDLDIQHLYKPLVAAIRKLCTSLCLQFKPHHIAVGAIFLGAKFLKVKLPSDGNKVWWQEFDITPQQLEEVSKQMLDLYEQNITGTGSLLSDVTSGAGPNHQLKQLAAAQVMTDEGAPANGQSSLLSATLKTQSQEFRITSRSVNVEVGQEESTEAQSSLEEGEDMAESKPNITEIKRTEFTMHTLALVTKVESGDGRTAEVKIGPPDDLKPTAMEKQRRSRVMDSCLTFDKREPSNDEIVPEVSDQAGHQQGHHAGREEQMVKFGYRLEHEAADGRE
ncbi:unnamed protein product, partial [Sphagnum compactum]